VVYEKTYAYNDEAFGKFIEAKSPFKETEVITSFYDDSLKIMAGDLYGEIRKNL
jgi:hypothetical protein